MYCLDVSKKDYQRWSKNAQYLVHPSTLNLKTVTLEADAFIKVHFSLQVNKGKEMGALLTLQT